MKLQIIANHLSDYLQEIPPIIQFDTPLVQEKIQSIKAKAATPKERARLAFEIARDEIGHSFDTQKQKVSISGEEVLQVRDGICFAKAHLLASLCRGMDIPIGFCYQRVLKNPKDPNSGHALHGLNAIYLEDSGWFRVDPRGNKPGINSQFSVTEEQLAYPIRAAYGEIDYPYVYARPLDSVIQAMNASENVKELFDKRPAALPA